MTADDLNCLCFNRLLEQGVGSGTFVIVVGAGVSIPLIPSGTDLRETMARACEIEDDPREPFWEFFQRVQDNHPNLFREIIIRTFSDIPEWHSEACHQIVSLPNKSIITLNYDDHLQAAFSRKFGAGWQERFAVYPVQAGKTFAFPSDFRYTPHLLAVHGYRVRNESASSADIGASWPDDGIILTTRQFKEHYFGQERAHILFHWWKQVLCEFSCLFIGTSLQEPGLHEVIATLIRENHPDFLRRKRIHLQDVRLQNVFSDRETRLTYPTPVPPLATIEQVQYDPKQGYRGLLEVLSRLTGEPLRGPLESAKQAPTFPSSFTISSEQ